MDEGREDKDEHFDEVDTTVGLGDQEMPRETLSGPLIDATFVKEK